MVDTPPATVVPSLHVAREPSGTSSLSGRTTAPSSTTATPTAHFDAPPHAQGHSLTHGTDIDMEHASSRVAPLTPVAIGPQAAAHHPSEGAPTSGGLASDSAKSPAHRGGLASATHVPSSARISSTVGAATPPHVRDLFTSPRSCEIPSSTFSAGRDLTSEHLAGSADASSVVVAPAASSSAHSIETGTGPTATVRPAPASAHQGQQHQMHSSRVQLQQSHVPAHAPPKVVPAVSAVVAELTSQMSAAFRAPSAPHEPHQPNTIDTVCHCLIVDEARIDKASADFTHLSGALGLAADRPALKAHLLAWFDGKVQADDISVAHVISSDARRLHINFVSLSALGRGLAALPFLVRCGSGQQASRWSHPCGPLRHKAPEMLSFSCASDQPQAGMDDAIRQLLESVNLEYTTFWSRAMPAVGRARTQTVHFSVLPRHTSGLAAVIDRLHLKCALFNNKLRVHAPNSINGTLARCSQCEQLGHVADKCPQYTGVAVRFLFKEPVSYHAMTTLVQTVGARAGYLGRGIDELKPDRRVTLLLGDALQVNHDHSKLVAAVREYRALLFQEPYPVQCKDRYRECHLCGSLNSAHECPFVTGHKPLAPAADQRHRAGGAPSSAPAAVESGDMCRAWHATKVCPRKAKGQRCMFKHPEDHVAVVGVCFRERDRGRCDISGCKFQHQAQLVQPQQAPLAAAPIHAADSLAVRSQVPAALAPAAAAAPTPTTRKRRAQETVAADAPAPDGDDVQMDDRDSVAPTKAASSKKPRATSNSFVQRNSFAALASDDNDVPATAPKRAASATRPTAVSSLSSLASPTKVLPHAAQHKHSTGAASTATSSSN